jgi:hypothetical protein
MRKNSNTILLSNIRFICADMCFDSGTGYFYEQFPNVFNKTNKLSFQNIQMSGIMIKKGDKKQRCLIELYFIENLGKTVENGYIKEQYHIIDNKEVNIWVPIFIDSSLFEIINNKIRQNRIYIHINAVNEDEIQKNNEYIIDEFSIIAYANKITTTISGISEWAAIIFFIAGCFGWYFSFFLSIIFILLRINMSYNK